MKSLNFIMIIHLLFISYVRSNNTYEIKGNIHEYNYFYINVNVGSKNQKQSLILDTGSPLTTFPCKSICEICGNHSNDNYLDKESESFNFKQCSNSTTDDNNFNLTIKEEEKDECELIEFFDNSEYNTQKLNKFTISYAEGSTYRGFYAYDDIKFYNPKNGKKNPMNILLNYPIGCVKYENFKLYEQKANGIFGLNMYEEYKETNILKIPYFQISLYKDGGGLLSFDNMNLEYELGHLHKSLNFKQIVSIDLKNEASYKFDIYGLLVDTLFVSITKKVNNNKDEKNRNSKSRTSIIINSEDRKRIKLKSSENINSLILEEELINFETNESFRVKDKNDKLDERQKNDYIDLKGEEVLVDSGSTLSLIPHRIFNFIASIFTFYCQDKTKCLGVMEKTQTTLCWKPLISDNKFYDSFPNIYFSVNKENNEFIQWKPKEYLIKMYFYNSAYYFKQLSNDIGYCLAAKESNNFVMGASLMLDKTLYFDLKNKKLHIKNENLKDEKNTLNNSKNIIKNNNFFGISEEIFILMESQFKSDILIFIGIMTMLLIIKIIIKESK